MVGLLARFLEDETGASAIEYALIGSGIFLAIVGVLTQVGIKLGAVFTTVNGSL